MNWLDTFCFISVARTQSFSIAARELMISQQAVSQHIHKLEEEVGYPLFLRNYQSSVLTKAGEMLLEYFAQRETLLQDFKRPLQHRTRQETLRLAWSQWVGCPTWFQAAITAFRTANPQVTVLLYDLDTREQASALERDEIDVLLTTRYSYQYLPVAWNMRAIAEQPVFLLGSKKHCYDPNMLSVYPYIACYAGESDDAGVRARAIRDCAQIGFTPQQIEVCPEMGSVVLNILIKGGLALGSQIGPLHGADEFVLLPTERTATVVLCRPYRRDNPLIEAFEHFLLGEKEALL